MPSSAIDSKLFGNLFGTARMRAVFSDERLVERYLEVEAALSKAQGRLGVIPQEAADEIVSRCNLDSIDFEAMEKRIQRVYYPILPLVEQLVKSCRDGLGEWSHYGATTQDIMDTALVLQLREAFGIIERELDAISAALKSLARTYRDAPMAGRSHLQHATPVTFGYKAAVWLSGVERCRERLEQLKPRILMGQFAGAAGTLASLGDKGLAVQAELCRELDLAQPPITWHTMHDSVAEVGCYLGVLTGSLAKIGTDVAFLMQTEVGEVFEPFQHGRGASSTMPQKRNPVSAELLIVAAKAVRQYTAMLLDGMIHDHERASGPWQAEWLAIPDAFIVTSTALHQAKVMLEGLEVDTGRMRRNLDITGGLIVSEAVMMGLAPFIGRQIAHDLVYDACRTAIGENRTLYAVLSEMPDITRHVAGKELEALCDPANYTGQAGEMVDRMLAIAGTSEGAA
ncbi:MAG: 3-carboxy-cis,cis-muconate cycloisomerase [Alphaproteobacteria bacterium]